jgi:hypothetical protein
MKADIQQVGLPLAEAEGQFAERRAMLNAAITAAECDLHVVTLLHVVFQDTAGGLRDVQFRHEDLKRRPDRLCCELTAVRSTVARAKATGLLSVRPSATRDGFRAANAYAINWTAVDRWNGRALPSVADQQTSIANQQTCVAKQQTSAAAHKGGEGGDSSCLSIKQEQENNPPPPPTSSFLSAKPRQTCVAIPQTGAGIPVGRTAWSECEQSLRRLGMKASGAAIAEAQRRGMAGDELAGLITHFETCEGLGPGAIFHAIREWRSGDNAADEHLWPTPAVVTKWRF